MSVDGPCLGVGHEPGGRRPVRRGGGGGAPGESVAGLGDCPAGGREGGSPDRWPLCVAPPPSPPADPPPPGPLTPAFAGAKPAQGPPGPRGWALRTGRAALCGPGHPGPRPPSHQMGGGGGRHIPIEGPRAIGGGGYKVPTYSTSAHRNTARQAMDGLWTEVCGRQKQSNEPGNNQHILNTPIIGRR